MTNVPTAVRALFKGGPYNGFVCHLHGEPEDVRLPLSLRADADPRQTVIPCVAVYVLSGNDPFKSFYEFKEVAF